MTCRMVSGIALVSMSTVVLRQLSNRCHPQEICPPHLPVLHRPCQSQVKAAYQKTTTLKVCSYMEIISAENTTHMYRMQYVIIYHYTGIANEQAVLWEETLDEDPTVELEARQGGPTPTNIDPRLYHDIQVLVSRLVSKASQLIGNETTNLAESRMHIRSKSSINHKVAHGSNKQCTGKTKT